MKQTFSIYKVMGILSILSAVCAAVENPNVSTSFQSSTTVPSQGQNQRLLTQPNNPLAAGGNDVVTGNVGGLRYFHGVVPYGSTYYSNAILSDQGTSAINSFLRQSTNPILSDRNPTQSRVFINPQDTTSSYYVQNGQKTPLSAALAQSQQNPYTRATLPSLPVQTVPQPRPLSTNNFELEQVLSRQLQLQQEAVKEKALEEESQSKFKNFFETELKPEELQKPQEETKPTEEPVKKPEMEVLEEFRKEQEKELLEPKPSAEETTKPKAEEKKEAAKPETEKPAQPVSHAEAEKIRGQYKTFKELSEAKFSDYMRAAEEFIRDGKYYKAADAYSLAAVWKSDDARAYLGQAFALFAAGEYMSSAYYLSRAIELDPAMAAKQYDLPALIGDRDVFENRLIEMTAWQQRSGSGELAFLMAYILYHDGKPAKAAEAIAKAQEKMPDSAAVDALKKVIIPESGTKP